MAVDLNAVIAEHKSNVGFREGPGNQNPWGPEQGISNAAYCDSAASMVPYHQGYRWWPESQFGEKGCAYTVTHVNVGKAHGEVRYDHASQGDPADVLAGDLVFYSWSGGSEPDHVETALEDCPSNGRTHNCGYNTGNPEGCYDLWRDRKYLLCRLRPTHYRDAVAPGSGPPPPPATIAPPFPLPADQWFGVPSDDPRNHSGYFSDTDRPGITLFQARLRDRGWSLGATGVFDQSTDKVVRQFQAEKNLTVDGAVGPGTWSAIWTAPAT
jgi:hypothetical protein